MLKRFLLLEQMLIPAVFNFVINAAAAWWLTRQQDFIPFWGSSSIAVDTLATALLLPLLTALITTPLLLSRARQGGFDKFPLHQLATGYGRVISGISSLSQSTSQSQSKPTSRADSRSAGFNRTRRMLLALRIGLCGSVIGILLALLVLWILLLTGTTGLETAHFIRFKALFAAVLGGMVSCMMGYWTLQTIAFRRLGHTSRPASDPKMKTDSVQNV